ncbi:MAG: hypothetical protein ACK5N0_03755 [Synechococcaceae cyanobacterium]
MHRSTPLALASRLHQPHALRCEALGVLFAAALGLTAPAATANPINETDLPAAVEASKAQLRRSWAADPVTARLPFPRVELLRPGVEVSEACSPGAPAHQPAPTAIYCANRDAVVLQHDLLTLAYRLHHAPAVSYWIAVGLAERVRPREPSLTPAASSLQVSCLAGVLLGATGPAQSADATVAAVKTAAKAYGDLFSAAVGTGPQRAYALLSGLGATSLDCHAAAMARLAAGEVPIPSDLGTRGPGSLGLEVSCRLPPACPRRFASMVGVGGV